MTKDAEVDMKDVELNEMDPEKQPMTGDGAGPEKNGSVKLKVPEEEIKFTGLSKEELMKVAGTAGWVRTRWALLVLFWLGWLGMLAGAIVIIVQAPRCKPIPEMNWWNEGPLYQIPDLTAFSSDGIKGVVDKLDNLNQLKVKGLVLGPLHTVQSGQPESLQLGDIDPMQGTLEELRTLLEKAHKKGMSVVLDLSPNYPGSEPWFGAGSDITDILDKLKTASQHWLDIGMDGIRLSNVATAAASPDWDKVKAVVQADAPEDTKKRALIGVVEGLPAPDVALLLNTSGVDLLLSDLLRADSKGSEVAGGIQTLLSDQQQTSLAWGLGASGGLQLASQVRAPGLVRLYQLLLLTLPGTPVFTYGDELGLHGQMVWDSDVAPAEGAVINQTAEVKPVCAVRQGLVSCRSWFRSLSELRGKERSLLHGDHLPLHSSSSSMAFLRVWDQSQRYVTAVNWGTTATTLKLTLTGEVSLPAEALVKLSTDPETLAPDSSVELDKLTLGPGQAVLLHYPFTA
ncbi:solute carrier family 3 member 2a [Aplochiton taeniatus]